jgi:hypothetical protein
LLSLRTQRLFELLMRAGGFRSKRFFPLRKITYSTFPYREDARFVIGPRLLDRLFCFGLRLLKDVGRLDPSLVDLPSCVAPYFLEILLGGGLARF